MSSAQDRKKIELILQDYLALMGDIEACLRFINVGMEHLRKHNLSTLQEVDTEAVRVVRYDLNNILHLLLSGNILSLFYFFIFACF